MWSIIRQFTWQKLHTYAIQNDNKMYKHIAHRTLEITGIQVKQLQCHQLLHQSLASAPSDCLSTTTTHSLKYLQASQTQSTHFPVWQMTHITNTVQSLPSMTGDTHHKHSPHKPQDEWHIRMKPRVPQHLKCTCVKKALETAFRTKSNSFLLHAWNKLNEGSLRKLFRILRTATWWKCEQAIVP